MVAMVTDNGCQNREMSFDQNLEVHQTFFNNYIPAQLNKKGVFLLF